MSNEETKPQTLSAPGTSDIELPSKPEELMMFLLALAEAFKQDQFTKQRALEVQHMKNERDFELNQQSIAAQKEERQARIAFERHKFNRLFWLAIFGVTCLLGVVLAVMFLLKDVDRGTQILLQAVLVVTAFLGGRGWVLSRLTRRPPEQ